VNPTGSFTSIDDWLPWLESLSPREIVLGLERVHDVLQRLALPRPARVIHVAGTNGKGSSVAMLEALLRVDGSLTGCYTSPHVLRYNERMRIDGRAASDAQIVAAFVAVEAAREDVPLTYFEFGTLAALVAFAAAGVQTLILEVGMGGRLDAVNAIEPDASLITNISLDHCAWLGDDRESIAREKAGIMRASKPVVFGSENVPAAIPACANETGANLLLAATDFDYALNATPDDTWSWRGQRVHIETLQRPALAGDVQLQNAAAVLALVEAIGLEGLLNSEHIDAAFGALHLPGRFQFIDQRRRWLLDVAHNTDSARVLSESLAAVSVPGSVTAIVGMQADKDVQGIIAPLTSLVDTWIAITVEGPRGKPAATLARDIANQCLKPCLIADDVSQAMQIADSRAGKDDLTLVTGSFFAVGPALEWLQKS
jgi:dihydrofolate synthase/folylpolyglutamate synthase